MERNYRARLGRVSGIFLSAILIMAASFSSGCGSDSAGGEYLGRKDLPSPEVLATSADNLTVAVHYVAFKGSDGAATTNESNVRALLSKMSATWAQCRIGFALEKYEEMDPGVIKARFNPANYSELDSMREALQNDTELLMIGTGTWNRSGDLGNSGSNCYSSFPGDQADGISCEAPVLNNGMLLSHEVGHWLNLIHTDDPTSDLVDDTTSANNSVNLMQHVVSPDNTQLTPGQCARARMAIGQYRSHAVIDQ